MKAKIRLCTRKTERMSKLLEKTSENTMDGYENMIIEQTNPEFSHGTHDQAPLMISWTHSVKPQLP